MSRTRRALLVGYLALLATSHLVWWARAGPPTLEPDQRLATVPAWVGRERVAGEARIAWRDLGPRDAPVVVVLHGSPGDGGQLRGAAGRLAETRRVLVPDLPGFGGSRPSAGDVSIAAHAREVAAWLDELGVARAHVVGFSMGGGVALELAEHRPDLVRSIVMLAAIGVQELELFGRHDLNHAVHGLQLALFHAARLLVPHFGGADGDPLSLAYPRNFFDTDQRPLRGILERYAAPMAIVHGGRDFLVPPAAAREHARVVPQAELTVVEERSHFLPWTWTAELAALCDAFFDRVERGRAATRATADPARVAAAAVPFDPRDAPPMTGFALVVAVLLLAAATFVSEDLTCIGAGLLVAQGRLAFVPAAGGCFLGILLGDMALYGLGRLLGRPALRRAPLRWVVTEDAVDRARAWFERKGAAVIFLSRFTPGLRLPTYVAAGVVRTRFLVFAFWFSLAGLLWTPALVGLAAWVGESITASLENVGRWILPGLLALFLALRLVERVVVPAFTWRGRRKLVGAWRRKTRWEFWPPWLFYLPVAAWLVVLSLRHRGFGKVAAANPAIPGGGFVGESKAQILAGLGREHPLVARWRVLPAARPIAERRALADAFLGEHGLAFPVVLKPDVGQRGSGVRILRDAAALDAALEAQAVDELLQEYVPGVELGVFWARDPRASNGRVISITEKRLPEVEGDGRRTLAELVLADDRAVCAAAAYFDANRERLEDVPPAGARVRLVELGTHARGAIFLDGSSWASPALEAKIEALSNGFAGFCFGRYDVRGASFEAIARGEFRVLELNGVTSEATHVYDPRHSLRHAYRTLFAQWSLAFEIARANLAAGRGEPTSLWRILRQFLEYRREQRVHGRAGAGSASAATRA